MLPHDQPEPQRGTTVLAFAGPALRGRLERDGIQVIGCGTVADALRGCPRYHPRAIVVEEDFDADLTGLLLAIRAACGAACPALVVFAEHPIDGADMVIGEPWDGPTLRALIGNRAKATLPPGSGPISRPRSVPPISGPVLRTLAAPASTPAGIERAVILEALGKIADPATAEATVRRALDRSNMRKVPHDRDVLEAFLLGPLLAEIEARLDHTTAELVTRDVQLTLGIGERSAPAQAPAPASSRDDRLGRSGHSSGTYRVMSAKREEGVAPLTVLVETSLEGPERRLRRVADEVVVAPLEDAATEAAMRGGVLVLVHDLIFDGRATAADLRSRGFNSPILVLVDDDDASESVVSMAEWLEIGWPASRPRLRRALRHASALLDPR